MYVYRQFKFVDFFIFSIFRSNKSIHRLYICMYAKILAHTCCYASRALGSPLLARHQPATSISSTILDKPSNLSQKLEVQNCQSSSKQTDRLLILQDGLCSPSPGKWSCKPRNPSLIPMLTPCRWQPCNCRR